MSITTNDWGRYHCCCCCRLTGPTTGGAVAAINRLRQQLGEPPPTTGGGVIAAVIHLCHQLGELLLLSPPLSVSIGDWGSRCQLLGEPSPPSSVSANVWGRRCCCHCRCPSLSMTGEATTDDWGRCCYCCPSPPPTGGDIVAIAAIVHLR